VYFKNENILVDTLESLPRVVYLTSIKEASLEFHLERTQRDIGCRC